LNEYDENDNITMLSENSSAIYFT